MGQGFHLPLRTLPLVAINDFDLCVGPAPVDTVGKQVLSPALTQVDSDAPYVRVTKGVARG